MFSKSIKLFGSLKLTVALLACCMVLVFFGTLHQVELGIHAIQQRYFESWLVFSPVVALFKTLVSQQYDMSLSWLALPLPGGYLVGSLLLINLVCAHSLHFKPRWNKLGISIIHAGVLLLILSGFVTSLVQREGHMAILEGEKANFAFNQMQNELVFTDTSASDTNTETAIPAKRLHEGKTISHESLPFSVHIKRYHPNANLYPQVNEDFFKQAPNAYRSEATRGIGQRMEVAVHPLPKRYSQDDVNTATAIIELRHDEQSLGTWLVSNVFGSNGMPAQTLRHEGKTWEISLRFKRYYNPYWVELIDMSHDVYPGTNIPKNYSSKVRIIPYEESEPRQALIYMNHPLRYEGLTYYQSSIMNRNNTEGTVLQVVKNPGWLLPYIAILLVGIGMCWQFGMHLLRYVTRQRNSSTMTKQTSA